ncbi:MAG: L,D-transpeptidase family protein, partial [Bosea sp. (in: a-proteobacteria)]
MLQLRFARATLVALAAFGLASCEETKYRGSERHFVPIPGEMYALMNEKSVAKSDPILIRSFKKESELEVWKKGRDGRYVHLKTYPICRWSGQLGPKKREGDRMTPEGFYAIPQGQMNPNSSFYLSFNMGFPNAYDRSHGSTGNFLMVHGACSSAGCYSMTDDQMGEIYALMREAHSGGQKTVQMQSYPFRMTAENLAKHRHDPNMAFWKNLKEGSDIFEVTKQEPKVAVCGGRYGFGTGGAGAGISSACDVQTDAQIASSVAEKRRKDEVAIASAIAQGTPAIKLVYEDGD